MESRSVGAPSDGSIVRFAICILIYAWPTLWLLGQPVVDADLWWHLSCGAWVWDHGTVPTTDPFSEFGATRPWVAYSWLFELLVYGLHSIAGLRGVFYLRLIMTWLIILSLHIYLVRWGRGFVTTVLLLSGGILTCVPLFRERPWLFTVLFSIWTLAAARSLLQGHRSRWAWALPLVFVLWANLHIQYVYGLMILATACLAAAITEWRYSKQKNSLVDAMRHSRPLWGLAGLTALCTVATLVNPYHWHLYRVVAEYATQPVAFQLVRELTPPTFRSLNDWAMLCLLAASLWHLAGRPRWRPLAIMLLLTATMLAFRAKRDAWMMVLAASTVIDSVNAAPATEGNRQTLTSWRKWVLAVVLIAISCTALLWAPQTSPERLQQAVAERYPVEAARFVREQQLPGPLFNHFNWGGYLIWSLPEHRVQIDGRTNLHGEQRLLQTARTWTGRPSWALDPELNSAQFVIAADEAALTSLLNLDSRFRIVYTDDVATVFVRNPVPEKKPVVPHSYSN